jgi:hypothetical protein
VTDKKTEPTVSCFINDVYQYTLFVRIGGSREDALRWFEKKFSAERSDWHDVLQEVRNDSSDLVCGNSDAGDHRPRGAALCPARPDHHRLSGNVRGERGGLRLPAPVDGESDHGGGVMLGRDGGM